MVNNGGCHLKPREPTAETRAKDSKISLPRHVLAPGLHCVEFAHKCLLDENKHVVGVIFFLPCRSACVLESDLLVDADMLFPYGVPTSGQASRGLPDTPRQPNCLTLAGCHKTAVAVQHLLASGSATCADFTLTNLLCC